MNATLPDYVQTTFSRCDGLYDKGEFRARQMCRGCARFGVRTVGVTNRWITPAVAPDLTPDMDVQCFSRVPVEETIFQA